MKDLLKHLENELESALSQLSGATTETNKKLEYIYEDLLAKTEMALEELDAERATGDSDNTKKENLDDLIEKVRNFREKSESDREEKYGPRRRPPEFMPRDSYPTGWPKVDVESPFTPSHRQDYESPSDLSNSESRPSPEEDGLKHEHHAMQDGGKESYEEMRQNIENVTASDLDPDRLRELANVAEEIEKEPVDPKDMSDDEFQKLISRLRPELVDWATGEKEMDSENVDKQKNRVLRQIRDSVESASHIAQNNSTSEAFKHLQGQIGDILQRNIIETDE